MREQYEKANLDEESGKEQVINMKKLNDFKISELTKDELWTANLPENLSQQEQKSQQK